MAQAQGRPLSRLTLDEYREKYKDFLIMEREDGMKTSPECGRSLPRVDNRSVLWA